MKVNVIVIPHAGGMASTYYKFKKFDSELLKFHFVELAGRGQRIHENLYSSFADAVGDIYKQIEKILNDGRPYILFGHSMGSWLTYELYYCILENRKTLPRHIIFSGNRSPYTKQDLSVINLNDDKFIEYIVKNHEANRRIFEIAKLKKIFLPILRADYAIMEKYVPPVSREKMKVDISVLGGASDPLLNKGFYDWENLTQGKCEYKKFQGKHFYIFQKTDEVCNFISQVIVNEKLNEY